MNREDKLSLLTDAKLDAEREHLVHKFAAQTMDNEYRRTRDKQFLKKSQDYHKIAVYWYNKKEKIERKLRAIVYHTTFRDWIKRLIKGDNK